MNQQMGVLMRKIFYYFVFILIYQNNSLARSITGEYRVPVDGINKNLEPYSTYSVTIKHYSYNKNPQVLNFPLPAALVGETKMITMTKVAGTSNQWEGKNIESAVCQVNKLEILCQTKFKDLNINPIKVEQVIEQNYSTEEAPQRKQVAALFGDSPIGIIKYKLKRQFDDKFEF